MNFKSRNKEEGQVFEIEKNEAKFKEFFRCLNYKDNVNKENNTFTIKNKFGEITKKNIIEKKLNKIEDKAQDCNAYLKIKHFLAKQVLDLENKIEEKDSFIMATIIKINNFTKFSEKLKIKYLKIKKKCQNLNKKFYKLKKIFNKKNNENNKIKDIKTQMQINLFQKDQKMNFPSNHDSPLNKCFDLEKSENSFIEIINKNDKNLLLNEQYLNDLIMNNHENNNSHIASKNINLSDVIESFDFKNTNKSQIRVQNEQIYKGEGLEDMKNKDFMAEIAYLNKTIKNLNEKYENKSIQFNEEIIDLKQRNISLNSQIKTKNSKIEQLECTNTLILNELIELIQALRTIDIKILNKIFLENLSKKSKEDFETVKLPSCLGIKYNILSAESFLSYLINTNDKEKNENKFESLKMNFPSSTKKMNYEDYIEKNKHENFLYKKNNYAKNEMDLIKNNYEITKNPKKQRFLDIKEEKYENDYVNILNNKQNDLKHDLPKLDLILSDVTKETSESLYNSLFDLDESEINSNSSSLDDFFNQNLQEQKQTPLFVYELPSEDIRNNYCKKFSESNHHTNKIFDFSKYEKQLNTLLEKNLNKKKLLTFSESD